MQRKAIFLDRDGVLNEAIIKNGKPYSPSTVKELIVTKDAKNALLKLKDAGFLLICITNQPDIARKKNSEENISTIHKMLLEILPLDDIFMCPHDDNDNCQCRKPKPGMLIEASHKYGIELSASIMIGDRWRDIGAGKNAGCKSIWIANDYDEQIAKYPYDFAASSLTQATEWIKNNLE